MKITINPERGQRLRSERNRLGLSQTAFAALAGQAKHLQILYEKGGRAPAADYLAAIHAAGADILFIVVGERAAQKPDAAAANEAIAYAKARREWLGAERRALAACKVGKGVAELGGGVGIKEQTLSGVAGFHVAGSVEDVVGNRGIIDAEPGNQAEQDHFKNPTTGSRVFQYIKLCLIHLATRKEHSRKASDPVDSIKDKSRSKGAR